MDGKMSDEHKYHDFEREALYNILSETEKLANVGGWEWDIATDVWTFSDNWLRIHGCSKRQLTTSELLFIAHPDDRPKIQKSFEKAITEGAHYEKEHRVIRQDTGEERYIRALGRPKLDDDGKTVKLFGSAQDITESTKAEKLLRENEEKFRHLFDHSPIGKTITHISGEMQSNASFAQMLGYPNDEFQNFKWQDITHPDDRDLSKYIIESIISGKKDFDRFTKRYIHKTGSTVWADVSTRLIRDSAGNPLYFITAVIDITDKKISEEALVEANEVFKRTERIANVGSWQWDIESDRVYWSEELFRIFGLDPSQGAPSYADHPKIFTPESMQRLDAAVRECINQGTPYEIEDQIIRPNGEIRNCIGRGQAQRDENGKIVRLVGSHQDITERTNMESALLESEEKYRLLFKNADDAIFVADPETGTLLDVNESAEELTGYNRNELIGKHQTFIHPPEKLDYYNQEFLKSVGDSNSKFFEMVVRNKNGKDIPVEISSGGTFHGKMTSFHVGFFRDISERVKVYDSLVKSESLFKSLYDNMTSGSAIYEVLNDGSKGSDYIVKKFNKKSLEIEGKTLAQVVGKSLFDLRPTIDDYGLIPVMKKVWETGEPAYFPIKIYQDEIYSNYYANYIFRIPTGEVVTIYNDVTDQKNSEIALKESEERFALAMEFANDGLFDWNLQTNEIYYSPVWKHILGYEDDELPNDFSVWEKLTHPEDVERSWKMQNELINKERDKFEIEFKMRHKDGHWVDILSRANALFDENGKAIRLIGTHVDISEKVQLETALRHAHKMEAIGNLAGGIAHEFNNVLAIILGNTELAIDDTKEWHPVSHNLNEIKTASLRAKDVIKQLLTFCRKMDSKREPIDIRAVVKESLKLLRAAIPSSIQIQENLPNDIDNVVADATQIHQLLINLCNNAAQAMSDEGGILNVELSNVVLNYEAASKLPDLKPGFYVRFSVNDTGCGIPPDLQDRIFDPYFTTKDIGKGTGMGLAVVHGIVKSHNGAIDIESYVGKGTVFHVYFPSSSDRALQKETELETLPTGKENILLVDDEVSLVEISERILSGLGYSVTSSTDPVRIIKLFESDPYKYDLIISDMTMPNLTGDKLSLELLKIRPNVPILICTGHSDKVSHENADEIGIKGLLMKPVMKANLAKTVREVLDDAKAEN